ncbi:MAG TPA: GntR family transcriptional regulator [Gammaproteobacteria bacterium]|nr:GntR family transcriptional regulator [Gammaproteobacteria bacterium]
MQGKSPIVHKTRTQTVAELLRERILSGQIQAGEPLRQDALARAFNVSRIPVREALLLLEAEGLVEFEAHKGAYATELSIAKVEELFELRGLIESHVFERSIDRLTPEDLDEAERILDEFDHALDTGTRVNSWSEMNAAFHQTLYRHSGRPEALELIRGINTQADRYIRMQLLYTAGIERAETEHRELIELCRRGAKDEALDLLRRHIEAAGASIKKLLIAQQRENA